MTAPGLSVNTERRELGTKEGGREVTADSADRDGTWVSIEPHEPTCLCGHAHRWSDHRGVQSKRTACLWEHTHTHSRYTHTGSPVYISRRTSYSAHEHALCMCGCG